MGKDNNGDTNIFGPTSRKYFDRLNEINPEQIWRELEFPGSVRPEFSDPVIDSAENRRFGEIREICAPKVWNDLVYGVRDIKPGSPAEDENGIFLSPEYVFIRLAADLKKFDGRRFFNLDITPADTNQKVNLLSWAAKHLNHYTNNPQMYLDFFNAIKELYPEEVYPPENKLIQVKKNVWAGAVGNLHSSLQVWDSDKENPKEFLELYRLANFADSSYIQKKFPITKKFGIRLLIL